MWGSTVTVSALLLLASRCSTTVDANPTVTDSGLQALIDRSVFSVEGTDGEFYVVSGEKGGKTSSTPAATAGTETRARESSQALKPNFHAFPAAKTGTHKTTTVAQSFVCSNEYESVKGSPWTDHLAEPYRATTLTASSEIGDVEEDLFVWTFGDNTVLAGREVQHTFTTLGRNKISLAQTIATTGKTHHLEGFVMVKYVRREVRQLTENDREAFFDSMETLYRLPTSEGNQLYGDDYKGIEFFVQMHLDGAGELECDHWHDDAGIMTHHVGYTLLFEQMLQLVNPTVSIPYWEYTIEYAMGLESYGDSHIFEHDWFGIASPTNSMHTVDKGRWAYLPIMQDADDFIHNAYGLLRTPWNVDGTPFVTRHNMTNNENLQDMVSCAAYESCFESTDFSSISNCLNGGTHGPVHILVGGEWNDPEEKFIGDVGYSEMIPLISKVLWRKGYLRTPSSCSVEENGVGDESTCRSHCPAELYESRDMSPYDVLMDVEALYWVAQFSGGTITYLEDEDRFAVKGHETDKEFEKVFWQKMLNGFCDPGHTGELFTSSAPYDPLFWVIHPTADRFLAWRRKLDRDGVEGWSFDETWGYLHGTTVGEDGIVCDWSDVRDGTLDMPSCNKGTCGGHNALDVLPFKIKVNGEVRKMSNLEWLEFIFPDNEDLPYVYNEYRWDDCAEKGFTIGTS